MKTSTIPYVKLSGQGNDFVVIDGQDLTGEQDLKNIPQWADRSSGVGFDQLLLVHPTASTSAFDVTIYNADGSAAEQCGNGMRALAFYIMNRQPELDIQEVTLHPPAGRVRIKKAQVLTANKQALVSVSLPGPTEIGTHSATPFAPATHVVQLSMGNPHLILVWPEIPSEKACLDVGGALQTHPNFPGGINVSLAHAAESGVFLRVYERGVGPTLACGSGACATVAALTTLGLDVAGGSVHQPGGPLVIHWQATPDSDHEMELTGTVDWIQSGKLAV
ncbi:MAG TPA: diaminopimelate epimerase [Wenzhouxiangella sp.]